MIYWLKQTDPRAAGLHQRGLVEWVRGYGRCVVRVRSRYLVVTW